MSDEAPISIPPHTPKKEPVRVTTPPSSPPAQLQGKTQAQSTPQQSQVPPPVQAPTPPPVRGFSKARARINAKEVFFRLAEVFLLAVSLFLVWWSFSFVLAKRQAEVKERNLKLTSMNREMDNLQRTWSEDQSAEVTKKYEIATNMSLSSGEGFLDWWTNLRK